MKCEPFADGLSELIEDGKIGPKTEIKERARMLEKDFEWDNQEARKIWCFGPEQSGANILADRAKGVQFLNEIRDSCEAAFQWATKEAPLTNEHMRNMRFNILDVTLHADTIHRGGGQIIPTCRKCVYASELTAKPRLQEPVFLVEIQGPSTCIGGVYSCLNTRRGEVVSEESMGNRTSIKAYLPVAESFKFADHLRSMTSGEAFPQMVFDHWQTVMMDPYDTTSKAYTIVSGIRKRKNLKLELPTPDD